jgi:hypothetical protein
MPVEYVLSDWTKIREGRVYVNLALVRPAQFAEGKMSPAERSRLLELIDSVAAITRCIYEPIVHGLGAARRIVKRSACLRSQRDRLDVDSHHPAHHIRSPKTTCPASENF